MWKIKDTTPKNDKDILLSYYNLSKKVNAYMLKDKISLDLTGYQEIVGRYMRLIDTDILEAKELTLLCNMWSDYFLDIANLIQFYLLKAQLDIDRMKADKGIQNDENQQIYETELKRLTQLIYALKLFYKKTKGQKKFFEKAYYHCVYIYTSS